MNKWLSALLISGLVALFATGCNTFDNEEPPEDAGRVPLAQIKPDRGPESFDNNPFNVVDSEGFKFGADDDSLPDYLKGLRPIEGLEFPTIYFAFDKDELQGTEREKLDKIGAYVLNNLDVVVVVEGNCDERGTEEYNRALGERRALSVKAYLSALGLSDDNMRTISFGEDNPAVSGSGESVWSQNRRADMKAYEKVQ